MAVTLTAPVQHSVDTIRYYGVNHCQMVKSLNYLIMKMVLIYIINQDLASFFSEAMP